MITWPLIGLGLIIGVGNLYAVWETWHLRTLLRAAGLNGATENVLTGRLTRFSIRAFGGAVIAVVALIPIPTVMIVGWYVVAVCLMAVSWSELITTRRAERR